MKLLEISTQELLNFERLKSLGLTFFEDLKDQLVQDGLNLKTKEDVERFFCYAFGCGYMCAEKDLQELVAVKNSRIIKLN